MKKYGLLLLIFVLAFTSFNCGAKKKDNRTVVTFWHSFVSSTIPALNELIKDFEKEHPDIKINAQYVPTGDALVQKLITSIQSNTAPDISWLHADFLDKLVESNSVYDMSTFVKGANGYTDDEFNDFFPQLISNFTHQGKLYAIPMEATVLALVYNKDLLQKAGYNRPPENWAELEEYAKKMTIDKDGDGKFDQYGFYIPAYPSAGALSIWEVLQWSPFLWQAGGEITDSTKSKVYYNSQAGVAALSLWKNLFDFMQFKKYSYTHDMGFASGNIAMIMDGPWDLPTFRKMKYNWGVASLPEGPAQKATYIAGEGLAIFKQSKNPDAAWTFIKWVTSPKVQAKFSINSGYLPVRKSTLNLEEYKNYLEKDAAMKGFVNQIAIAKQRPVFDKYYININQNIAEAIEKVLLGNAEIKKSLDESAAKSNKLLSSK